MSAATDHVAERKRLRSLFYPDQPRKVTLISLRAASVQGMLKDGTARRLYPYPVGPTHRRVYARADLYKAPIGPVWRDMLILGSGPFAVGPVDALAYRICQKHNIAQKDLCSYFRSYSVVRARQEFCWEMRAQTTWSYQQIANYLNRKKDHTFVMRAARAHQKRIDAGTAL